MKPFHAQLASLCSQKGCVMARPDGTLVPAPITTDSWPVPKDSFNYLVDIMPLWCKVIDRAARDTNFVLKTLEGSDAAFTGKYLSIYRDIYHSSSSFTSSSSSINANYKVTKQDPQRLMLAVFRADYLIGEGGGMPDGKAAPAQSTEKKEEVAVWKNVEVNTISVAFPALSTRATMVHHAMATEQGQCKPTHISSSETDLIEAFANAHAAWLATCRSTEARPVVVCFVVQQGERNTGDQSLLANGLREQFGIVSVRRSLVELCGEVPLSTPSLQESLLRVQYDGDYAAVISLTGAEQKALNTTHTEAAVSLFYFRSCYGEKDFPSDACWDMRRLIEESSAIKCPSVPHHLCTWKRIQRGLSDLSTLRRYADSDEECARLLRVMVGQYLLHHDPIPGGNEADVETQNAESLKVMMDAIQNPAKYVLKTQKEGTGKIFEGDEMIQLLQEHLPSSSQAGNESVQWRRDHLLMERINSYARIGSILRKEGTELLENLPLEGELGIFGVMLNDGAHHKTSSVSAIDGLKFFNHQAGYLLRSKPKHISGGGIMSGVAALDSLCLL